MPSRTSRSVRNGTPEVLDHVRDHATRCYFRRESGRLCGAVSRARCGRQASAPSGRVPTTANRGRKRPHRITCRTCVLSVASGPSPTGTPISRRFPSERTTDRRRRPPRNRAARYRRPREAPQSFSTTSQRPGEVGATTSSPCRLHGLLPGSPERTGESRHAAADDHQAPAATHDASRNHHGPRGRTC